MGESFARLCSDIISRQWTSLVVTTSPALLVQSRWLRMQTQWFSVVAITSWKCRGFWFFKATKPKTRESMRWQRPIQGRVRSLSECLFQGNLLTKSLRDKRQILNCPHAWRWHVLSATSVSGPCLPCFSISLTADTCKEEKMCQRVEDRLNRHAQNQGKPGTLKPSLCFYPGDPSRDKFILLLHHHTLRPALCHLQIPHPKRKPFTQMVSGSWLLFSLKCPANCLTRTKLFE